MNGYPATFAVRGSGIAALLSAIAIKRAFPSAEVSLFTSTADRRSEFPGAATPFIHHFHRQIGLDDRIFAGRTTARIVHRTDWQVDGQPGVSIYPFFAVPYPEGVALHQLWRSLDEAERPEWATVVRRFQTDTDRAEGHGIRFDANAYLKLLGEMAAHLKIAVKPDGICDPAAFDLFVVADDGRNENCSWNPSQRLKDTDFDQIVFAPDKVVWATAHGAIAFPLGLEAFCIDQPWSGNRLAVGRAALSVETFDGQSLCAVMADILRALALMPTAASSNAEIDEYNRRTASVHAMLSDWHVFKWRGELTAGLRQLLDQFAHRGRVPFRDEDPVSAAEWINWLLSKGNIQKQADASASSLNRQQIFDILGID